MPSGPKEPVRNDRSSRSGWHGDFPGLRRFGYGAQARGGPAPRQPLRRAPRREARAALRSVLVTAKSPFRRLVSRLLLAVLLVLVFTGVAWDESGDNGRHLGTDLAIGAGATAVIYSCWWLAKRVIEASKRALRQGYEEALALENHHARRVGRWLGEARRRASRPEHGEAMVRDAARRAGHFVGSAKRAFREASGDRDQQVR